MIILKSRSNASGYDQRLEIFGPLGTLSVANPTPALVRASNRTHSDAHAPFISHYAGRYQRAYRQEIEHLLAVTRGADRPIASLHEGRAALALALAAGESVASGGPVNLS